MDFDDLVGTTLDFYGVADLEFKLGNNVWLAVEDEEDGYRSSLGAIELPPAGTGPFFKIPIAQVILREKNDDEYFTGYLLVDALDNHVWLRIGTNNSDSYYPLFVFEYTPKEIPMNTERESLQSQKEKVGVKPTGTLWLVMKAITDLQDENAELRKLVVETRDMQLGQSAHIEALEKSIKDLEKRIARLESGGF